MDILKSCIEGAMALCPAAYDFVDMVDLPPHDSEDKYRIDSFMKACNLGDINFVSKGKLSICITRIQCWNIPKR